MINQINIDLDGSLNGGQSASFVDKKLFLYGRNTIGRRIYKNPSKIKHDIIHNLFQ